MSSPMMAMEESARGPEKNRLSAVMSGLCGPAAVRPNGAGSPGGPSLVSAAIMVGVAGGASIAPPSPSRLFGGPFTRERVGRVSKENLRAFHQRLGQGRMGMDNFGQVPGRRAHFHREHPFRDELAGVATDDPHTQNAFGLRIDQQFGQTIRPIQTQGAAGGAPREFCDFDALAFGLCFGFGQA